MYVWTVEKGEDLVTEGGRGGWDLTRSRLILATVTWELGIGGLARALSCRKRGWETSGQYFCNDFTF